MGNYELVFVVEGIDEDLEERLLEQNVNVATTGRLQRTYVDAVGDSYMDAVIDGYRRLVDLGVRVQRLHLDLVNQADIAERTGISQAGVAKWVRSHKGHDRFPIEHDWSSTGPVWAWADVNEWIRRNREGKFDGYCSLNRRQVEEANRWVEQNRETLAASAVGRRAWVTVARQGSWSLARAAEAEVYA